MRNVSKRLIDHVGFDATLLINTSDEFDPQTGDYKLIAQEHKGKGVYSSFKSGILRDKTHLSNTSSSTLLFISEDRTAPSISDKIIIEDKSYEILELEEVKYKNETVMYRLYLNSGKSS